MKKTLFVALLACFTLMFASCNKEKELNGTKWKTHTTTSQQINMEGVAATVNMTIDGTMEFTSTTAGSMTLTISGSVSAMGMTFPMDAETNTEGFTYTFDGESGVLTATDEDETVTLPFTYNKKDNTITVTMKEKDEETGMEMNIEMLFNEEK